MMATAQIARGRRERSLHEWELASASFFICIKLPCQVQLSDQAATQDAALLETSMDQNEVMKLFEQEAALLDKTHIRQSDMIVQLAQLIADSRHQLSDEHFAILVRIGAALHKKTQSQNRARADIASTMRESLRDSKS